jgi:hypothetical protein
MAKEAIALARALGYQDCELLEAVDGAGLSDTLSFLRRECSTKSISMRLM